MQKEVERDLHEISFLLSEVEIGEGGKAVLHCVLGIELLGLQRPQEKEVKTSSA